MRHVLGDFSHLLHTRRNSELVNLSVLLPKHPTGFPTYKSTLHHIQQARCHEQLSPLGIPIALNVCLKRSRVIVHLVLALKDPWLACTLRLGRRYKLYSCRHITQLFVPELPISHDLLTIGLHLQPVEDGNVYRLRLEPWRRGEIPEEVVAGIEALVLKSGEESGLVEFLLIERRYLGRHAGGFGD